jgi:hypothetical protein
MEVIIEILWAWIKKIQKFLIVISWEEGKKYHKDSIFKKIEPNNKAFNTIQACDY